MTQFAQALEATRALLKAVGEGPWAERIAADLAEWNASQAVSHHLSMYGGMGSFDDVLISRANGHRVTPIQEPWADSLLQYLRATCYVVARNQGRDVEMEALSSSFPRSRDELTGWRCLACGHGETTTGQVESLLAGRHLPRAVIERLEKGTLQALGPTFSSRGCLVSMPTANISGIRAGPLACLSSIGRIGCDPVRVAAAKTRPSTGGERTAASGRHPTTWRSGAAEREVRSPHEPRSRVSPGNWHAASLDLRIIVRATAKMARWTCWLTLASRASSKDVSRTPPLAHAYGKTHRV